MVVIGYDLMGQIRRVASEASPQGDRVGGERLGDGLQLPVAGMGRGGWGAGLRLAEEVSR